MCSLTVLLALTILVRLVKNSISKECIVGILFCNLKLHMLNWKICEIKKRKILELSLPLGIIPMSQNFFFSIMLRKFNSERRVFSKIVLILVVVLQSKKKMSKCLVRTRLYIPHSTKGTVLSSTIDKVCQPII